MTDRRPARAGTRTMRVVAVAALALLALVPAARAQDAVQQAAQSLASDPVYVDPAAGDLLSAGDAAALRSRIERGDAGPVYVAVLPQSARAAAGGSTDGVLQELHSALGRRGTYVAVAG